jgi:hypothetical protein
MTAPQLVATWALLALAVFGIPGAALGWWAGRRALRRALDQPAPKPIPCWSPPAQTGDLEPFPANTEPLLLMSVHLASLAAHERDVRWMIAEAERRIPYR